MFTVPQSGAGRWESLPDSSSDDLAVPTPSRVTKNKESQVSTWTDLSIGSPCFDLSTMDLYEYVLDFYLMLICKVHVFFDSNWKVNLWRMLTCCPLSLPGKALLSSCWALSVGKPPWEPWAAVPQTASRGQLLLRARFFKALQMFSCQTSRCVAFGLWSFCCVFLFRFLCNLLKMATHLKFISKNMLFFALFLGAVLFFVSHPPPPGAPCTWISFLSHLRVLPLCSGAAQALCVSPAATILTHLLPWCLWAVSPEPSASSVLYDMGSHEFIWKNGSSTWKSVWSLLISFSYSVYLYSLITNSKPPLTVSRSTLLEVGTQHFFFFFTNHCLPGDGDYSVALKLFL